MRIFVRHSTRSKRRGSVLLIIVMMLAIMFIFFTVNAKILQGLRRDVDAIDKRQTKRLAAFPQRLPTSSTNSPSK